MAMPQRDDTIEILKRPAKWSAEAFGEGGYEVVPPEKEEEFRKKVEEESRRRRPGAGAAAFMAIANSAFALTVPKPVSERTTER